MDTCSYLNVLHTNHHVKGDTGQYFYFDESDFDAYVGDSDWDRKTFQIVQKGSRKWTGSIFVWKATSDHGAHGRRYPMSESGSNQWVTGDTVEICKSGNFQ